MRLSHIQSILGIAALVASPVFAGPADARPKYAALVPVPFNAVRIDDPFWSPRIETVQTRTIPDLLKMAEGRIKNFAIIAGQEQGKLMLANSPDSDLYKILEAAAYTLAWRPDPALDRQVDEVIAKIAAAQARDGYLNTQYMLPLGYPASPGPDHRNVKRYGYGPDQRWKGTIAEWPRGMGQLYCAGHLFEAAAAHYRATGKRNFLEVAIKLADHVYRAFPPGRPIEYADHPQIGIGLVKLYQVTGDDRYLALADHIVHHGNPSRPPDIGNGESHKPPREQRKAYGHCVRTGYVYGAMTDLAAYLDDKPARVALDSLWHSIVDRRMFIHGGVGDGTPAGQHGEDYHLPNERCYCECCANIAQAQWNHRLNALYGDARYADLTELEAYNGGLSGISLQGTEYFYTNKLAASKSGRGGPHGGERRRYLFCCPSKLPGFVAGIGRWVYAKDDSGIYVNLYVGGSATVALGETAVRIRQQTRYPWDGKIVVTLGPERPATFDLCLRIPGWASGRPLPSDLYRFSDAAAAPIALKVNGQPVAMPALQNGYARIPRQWKSDDTVELDLPMPIRRAYARQEVEADRGRVALMRGPILYCLEEVDNPGSSALNLALPKDASLVARHRDDLLGSVTVLRGRGLADGKAPVDITAVPYYAWQNRGVGEMTVWIIEDASQCKDKPKTDSGVVPQAPRSQPFEDG